MTDARRTRSPDLFLLLALAAVVRAQDPPLLVGGHVLPSLTVMADGVGSDSETGIGALIPWANRLWAIGYVAHTRGTGIGLYEIDAAFRMSKHPASVTGTFANRMVHWESKQAFLGPYAIDADGNVRVIEALKDHRLTATARHLDDPKGRVYFLTMEGLLFEVDVATLAATQLFDLTKDLQIDAGQPHFKGMHTAQGRVVVANNTYEEPEYLGERHAGRLAEWDGKQWRVIEYRPFVEVSGKQNPQAGERFGNTIWAMGFDRESVLLEVLHDGRWTRYRLPKGSQSWDHTWNTEWMRIREAQTERYLMDAFGLFYDLPGMVYGQRVFGIRPIASHLRIVPDFCHYRGVLVLAGDQTDNAVGQPQSGLWLGGIDDLWRFGKPAGWGGVWRKTSVLGGQASDPFLMTGFEHKGLHLRNEGGAATRVRIEVDFLGDGSFAPYAVVELAAGQYLHHEFETGFSAHWVRLVAEGPAILTAQFHYH
ncbi:MAG: hypothetical protein R3F56_26105 [Planctomycetota bacterium]